MRERRRLQRKRTRIIVLSIIIVLTVILIVSLTLPKDAAASEPVRVVSVQVQPGDTLWSLAEMYDDNSMDLRHYIFLIERYNKLENDILQPGQTLLIPVYGDSRGTLALTSTYSK